MFVKTSKCFLGLFFFTTLFAGEEFESRVSDLEKQMLEVSTETRSGNYSARFATQYKGDSSYYLEVFGGPLIWKSYVGGRDYAYSTSNMSTLVPKTPFQGSVESLNFPFDVGGRVGVAYSFSEEMWTIKGVYSTLTSIENKGNQKDWPEGFMGITGYLTPALKINSDYKISFNDLSLLFGKAYFISSMIQFFPSIGVKLSWIDQNQTSQYQINLRQDNLVLFDAKLKDKCDFFGVGPEMGIDTKWFFYSLFYLQAGARASALYGNYKVKDEYLADEERIQNDNNLVTSASIQLKGNTSFISPTVQVSLGLGAQTILFDEKLQIDLGASYEANYFWRQNEMLQAKGILKNQINNLTNSTSSVSFQRTAEDLAFSGISIFLRFVY